MSVLKLKKMKLEIIRKMKFLLRELMRQKIERKEKEPNLKRQLKPRLLKMSEIII